MESIGELIEKLIIANIKLWMIKDGQTLLAETEDAKKILEQLNQLTRIEVLSEKKYDTDTLKELIERLSDNPDKKKIEHLKDLIRKDIQLCELRAELRKEINRKLGDTTPTDNTNQYGDH